MNTTNVLEVSHSADEAIPPPPLSIDNGSADGLLNNNNDDAAAIASGKSPLQSAKKNIVNISIAVLLVGTVGFAVAMFRPGGPGRPASSIQSNFGSAIIGPTYYPTYVPTYFPTSYMPTYVPTYTPTVPPTPSPVKPAPELVVVPPTPAPVKPTPRPTPAPVEQTSYPTSPAPVEQTFFPTAAASDQNTVTVSTEVTGPPTLPNRDPVV